MTRVGTFMLIGLAINSAIPSAGCKQQAEGEAEPTAEEEEDGSCYAPGKNLSEAYEQGSVGCQCDPEDEDQCIEGVALVCESGRWQAVEDGPCFPEPGEPCGNGFCSQYGRCERRADGSEQCIAKLTVDVGSGEYMSPASGGAEDCDDMSCTPYAYCARSADGGQECRAKLNAGATCTAARACVSGNCSAGTCVARARRTKGCIGTWDCGSEQIARVICGSRDCEVCVQGVTANGEPSAWAALENASECDCPEPTH